MEYDLENMDIAWCPGCGNFPLLTALKGALSELAIKPQNLVIASGIGQAAKTPHYLKTNFFNGLHGRALPPAAAIKAANPALVVIAEGGDGDMYGEGGNHFIQAIKRNPDITCLIHNNMVYALTKGQASPTSQLGMKTPIQVNGVVEEPINPIALAVAMGASFVARAFAGDIEGTKGLIKQAIGHHGFAIIDIFQPCVSFNKINTFAWFKEHTYYLDGSHNPKDREEALRKAVEREKMPLGLIYLGEPKATFEENVGAKGPLWTKSLDQAILNKLINEKH